MTAKRFRRLWLMHITPLAFKYLSELLKRPKACRSGLVRVVFHLERRCTPDSTCCFNSRDLSSPTRSSRLRASFVPSDAGRGLGLGSCRNSETSTSGRFSAVLRPGRATRELHLLQL